MAQPNECQFGMRQCVYLQVGHVVGNEEVRPENSKIAAVMSFPTLVTKPQLRAFLGLTEYYRTFVPDFSAVHKEEPPK